MSPPLGKTHPAEVQCTTIWSQPEAHSHSPVPTVKRPGRQVGKHLLTQGPRLPHGQTQIRSDEPGPRGHICSLRAQYPRTQIDRSLLTPSQTQSHTRVRTHTHKMHTLPPCHTHCTQVSHLPNTPSLQPGPSYPHGLHLLPHWFPHTHTYPQTPNTF